MTLDNMEWLEIKGELTYNMTKYKRNKYLSKSKITQTTQEYGNLLVKPKWFKME